MTEILYGIMTLLGTIGTVIGLLGMQKQRYKIELFKEIIRSITGVEE